ncbi:MAG: DEAD/DEAH box helicase, partial [Acetobacteraceae bacterium]|nr:DEAD/DEAH box helicase [Acetobacteraceae bacterium]
MSSSPSEPALALFLLRQAAERGSLLAILRSAGRLDRAAGLAAAFAGKVEVLVLPPWDVLPYDRAAPSAAIVGRRVLTLTALSRPATKPRLLLTSADAALQRVRPPEAWRSADVPLRPGDRLEMDAFRALLAERGYHWDERVDEPGEVALRGQVIDIFPAGAAEPARLELDEDRIVRIAGYDPVSLRTKGEIEELVLRPAIEFPLDPDELEDAEALLEPDTDSEERPAELNLPRRLIPIFDLLPGAPTYRDPEVPERWRAAREAVDDAFAAVGKAGRVTGQAAAPPRPNRLYITVAQAEAACGDPVEPGDLPGEELPAPRRLDDLLEAVRRAGPDDRIVIAAPADPGRVAASLRKRGLEAEAVASWGEAGPGKISVLVANPASGLRGPGVLLVPIGPLLRPRNSAALWLGDEAPRIGETVVHLEHGVCRLTGLKPVNGEDRIGLEFADGAELLIAPDELDRVWRYGEGGAGLDRMGGEAWRRKREEIEAELVGTAQKLAEAAAARASAEAPVLPPPPERYAQVARRFPYVPSEDQRAAVHAVLRDLASGHPMDRLLCGDVGFGKTEVAIRAASAVAMAGWQVAIAAPTTVLARQHLDVFRRRFAGTGVRVEALIRAAGAEATSLRAAIRRGEPQIVIG